MNSNPPRMPRESRLLLLLAALGGEGTRPPNRDILRTVPGYPKGVGDGMRALRRDLKDLSAAGLLIQSRGNPPYEETRALRLLGPVAARSRQFPFRDPVLRAWRRFSGLEVGAGTLEAVQEPAPKMLPSVVSLGSDWPGKVEFLHRAILEARNIGFQYLRPSRRRGFKFHQVRPYGLGLRDAYWYLAGFDAGRKDVTLFRLSRMRRERVLPGTFERPRDFDLRRFLNSPAWSFGKRPVRVRVKASGAALGAIRELPPETRNLKGRGRRPSQAVVLCGDLLDFARWSLPFGSEMKILAPARARMIRRNEALKVARS